MSDKESNDIYFETWAMILVRSCILGIALLLLWFVFFLIVGDWAYATHSNWFEITSHDFDLMNYYGMAFVKIVVILFFFIPYLAVKLTMIKKKESHR